MSSFFITALALRNLEEGSSTHVGTVHVHTKDMYSFVKLSLDRFL